MGKQNMAAQDITDCDCGKKCFIVAEGSFDPPTLGLWAQCASSAPFRFRELQVENTQISNLIA